MRSWFAARWLACALPQVLVAQVDTTRGDTAYLAPTSVTVTRTRQDLSRAPYAISVATQEQIQRGKTGFALDDALAGIPGVQVDNRFNYALGERISIRGFGARTQFGVRGVRVVLDGIPMTLADGQTTLGNVNVTTLGRAEVLRGPASSFYGNAAGGVIQLESASPLAADGQAYGGSLRIDAGDHGLFRQQLTLAARRDSTAIDVSGARLFFDGFRQWNDATNDRLAFTIRNQRQHRRVILSGSWAEHDARNPGGLSPALLAANRDTVSPTNYNNRTGERGRQGQVGASLSQAVGRFALEASLHGLRRQVDNPIPFTIIVVDRDAGGGRLSGSTALSAAGRQLRLAMGSELQLQRDDRRNFANNAGARGALTLNQFERVDNLAFFVDASVPLVDRLTLSLGARQDRVRFDVEDRLVDATNPDESGSRTMQALSPGAGIVWSARPLDVYANVSTAFETPTTSELANQPSGAGGINPGLEPQRTRSVEVGARHRFRGAWLSGSAEMAVYDAHITDALVPFQLVAGGRQFYENAGRTRHRGVEVGASLVLPFHTGLRVALTHTDARFVEFTEVRGGVTTVHDGKRVPGVAMNRADATATVNAGPVTADWEVRAPSSIPVDNANTARSAAYVVHSVRVAGRDVRMGRTRLRPSVGILNVFDVEHNSSVIVNANGSRFFEPGPPRSLYGGVSVIF